MLPEAAQSADLLTRMSLLLAAISLGAGCGSDSPPVVNTSGTAFPTFLEPYVPVDVRRDTDLTATAEVWFYPELEGDVHTVAYTRPETGLHILVRAGGSPMITSKIPGPRPSWDTSRCLAVPADLKVGPVGLATLDARPR